MGSSDFLFNGPNNANHKIVLAHGAGAPMNSNFMETIAIGLGKQGFRIIRFNFSYMKLSQVSGKKRPPNATNMLINEWSSVISEIGCDNLIIGGKSMGGRVASMIKTNTKIKGIVCLGYPFHPPGKDENLRVSHLLSLSSPMLICQGERDVFGSKASINNLKLPDIIKLHWLKDGDHSFKPKKSSEVTERDNLESAIKTVVEFIRNIT